MPPVILDVSRLLSRFLEGKHPTGVDRVSLAYVNHYGAHARAALAEKGWVSVLSPGDSARMLALLAEQDFRKKEQARWLAVQGVAKARLGGRFDGAVVLHTSHSGIERPRYFEGLSKRGARVVCMVHDLIPMTHPEYCRPGVMDTHRQRIHTALRHSAGIIGNSHYTLDTLREEALRAGLPMPPAIAAHLGIDVRPGGEYARPLPGPYFVMLGTIEPRKNHWLMLHVWRELAERLGDAAPTLVVIGRRGWECENVVDMLERCQELNGKVIEENRCGDDKLSAYLRHAQALLFPSFAEGYGIPLVEALAHGLPVLASNLPVFREVAGDLPDYLPPLDGAGWAARIMAYADGSAPGSPRQAKVEALRGYEAPGWEAHCEAVNGFIETL